MKKNTNNFYHQIKKSFNNAAPDYDSNAVLQHEIGHRLIDRLDFFTIRPEVVVDLGMGTGLVTNKLATKYDSSTIIGLDFADNMLHIAKNNHLKDNNTNLICGDINKLPLADRSIDIIFSNFTFQWCENIADLFKECHRVLKPNGLLFFSIPGPDTLYELRESLNAADPDYSHTNNFIDMHDIGDILVQNKFAHPVMDNDIFTLTYSKVANILRDIKSIGANIKLNTNYRNTMFGKSRFNKLIEAYNNFLDSNNKYPLTYEVIYGHAFKLDKPVKVKHPELSEVAVPIEKIIYNTNSDK